MPQRATGRARVHRVALPACRSGLAAGTGVLTTDGILPVEFLRPGDRVVTHDAGALPLARLVRRRLPAHEMIRVRPGVLDPEAGERAFTLSARQTLLIRDWRARAMFGQRAALVEAARLVDGLYMQRLEGTAPVTLFQLVFDDAQHLLHLGDMHLLASSARLPHRVSA